MCSGWGEGYLLLRVCATSTFDLPSSQLKARHQLKAFAKKILGKFSFYWSPLYWFYDVLKFPALLDHTLFSVVRFFTIGHESGNIRIFIFDKRTLDL